MPKAKTTAEARTKRREVAKAKLDAANTQLVEQLIATMEQNTDTWSQPWATFQIGQHHRVGYTTGTGQDKPEHILTGGNQMRAAITALIEDFSDTRWATYKQWETVGAQVQKGQHGTVFTQPMFGRHCQCPHGTPAANCPHEDAPRVFLYAKTYRMFNENQVDGAPPVELPDDLQDVDPIETVEQFVKNTGADIVYVNPAKAFYAQKRNRINLPPRDRFETTEGFYSTMLHELTHWTLHETRINRPHGRMFGDPLYAREELVAEIGSAMLAAQLRIEPEPHPEHTQYLQSWIQVLKEEPDIMFEAAGDAQKAVTFLNNLQPAEEAPTVDLTVEEPAHA